MFALFLAVLLIGVCWAFGYLSLLPTSAVIVTDSLAAAFRWAGVTSPVLGWALLGVLTGGLLGVFVGVRRAGRRVSGGAFGRMMAVGAVAMLVAGSRLPADESGGSRSSVLPRAPRRTEASAGRARGRARSVAPVQAREPAHGAGGGANAEQTDTLGGEVTLTPDSAAAAEDDVAVRSASRIAQLHDRRDPAVVADVRGRLAEARAATEAGDYAAALRALTGADEAVTIAVATDGEQEWLAGLRREVIAGRGSMRAACQTAAAQASGRGEVPPSCE